MISIDDFDEINSNPPITDYYLHQR